MIRIKSTKGMPDNPELADLNPNQAGKWFNNVRYDVFDKRTKAVIFTKSGVCYSSICNNIAGLVSKGDEKLPDNMFIRYFCKNGHNILRHKFIVYVAKIFCRYFKDIVIYWSDADDQIVVDAYCKGTTPVESIFMFGQFLRLSWEQFHEWKLGSDKHYLFNHMYEALHDQYFGHIPTLLVASDLKNFSDRDKRYCTALMISKIKNGKVFKPQTQLRNYIGKKFVSVTPYIQEKIFQSVVNSLEYKKRKYPEVERTPHW